MHPCLAHRGRTPRNDVSINSRGARPAKWPRLSVRRGQRVFGTPDGRRQPNVPILSLKRTKWERDQIGAAGKLIGRKVSELWPIVAERRAARFASKASRSATWRSPRMARFGRPGSALAACRPTRSAPRAPSEDLQAGTRASMPLRCVVTTFPRSATSPLSDRRLRSLR